MRNIFFCTIAISETERRTYASSGQNTAQAVKGTVGMDHTDHDAQNFLTD